jgi:hypothetical protein
VSSGALLGTPVPATQLLSGDSGGCHCLAELTGCQSEAGGGGVGGGAGSYRGWGGGGADASCRGRMYGGGSAS